jgi:hypothetical protein
MKSLKESEWLQEFFWGQSFTVHRLMWSGICIQIIQYKTPPKKYYEKSGYLNDNYNCMKEIPHDMTTPLL